MYEGLGPSHKQSVCSGVRKEEQQADCNGPARSAPGRGQNPMGRNPQCGRLQHHCVAKVNKSTHMNVPHPPYPFLLKERHLIFTKNTSQQKVCVKNVGKENYKSSLYIG